MFGIGGVLGTGLALIVLEVLVTSAQNSASGASAVTSLLEVPGRLAKAWMDPTRPLIPDKTGGAAAANPAQASSTATGTLTAAA